MDVKDILGVEKDKNASKIEEIFTSKIPKKSKKQEKKKPEGVSREVFALTAGAPPPVVPASSDFVAAFKEKRKLSSLPAVKWNWQPFRNPARNDGLVFYHWRKAEEGVEDYRFARFNKKLTFFDYTNEQYEKYFVDPNWTKEQTDELWDLCKQFDLRFIVIADRFSGDKSIEDLKERYYSISKKLLELNASPGEDLSKHPLYKFTYNKESEIERKKQYERLYSRTKEEIEEEKMLAQEYKRIEAMLKKLQKDKNRVMKLTQSALGDEIPSEGTLQKKRKIGKKGEELSEPSIDHIISPLKGIRKEKASGVHVRSHSIMTPLSISNKMAKRVDELLIDLGVGIRPMPTAEICKAFNKLRQDIVILLNLENHVSQKDYHLRVLKDHKQAQESDTQEVKSMEDISEALSSQQTTPTTPKIKKESEKKKRPNSSSLKSERKPKKKKKE